MTNAIVPLHKPEGLDDVAPELAVIEAAKSLTLIMERYRSENLPYPLLAALFMLTVRVNALPAQ